jgi:hypothetical protein
LPHLEQFYEQAKPLGLEMVAIDDLDAPKVIRQYVKDSHYTFIVATDKVNVPGAAADYGVAQDGTPDNFLLDSTGRVVDHITGPPDEALLAGEVLKVTRGKKA